MYEMIIQGFKEIGFVFGSIKEFKVRKYEYGLHFIDKEFAGVLKAGSYRFFDPLNKHQVEICSVKEPRVKHPRLDEMVASGKLGDAAQVIELTDTQRCLLWVDDRLDDILPPGRYVYWNGLRKIRAEVIEVDENRFEHKQLTTIAKQSCIERFLRVYLVESETVGLLYQDGKYIETLAPGRYAFWQGVAMTTIVSIDKRETMVEIGGQDVMTSEKVTLRLNAQFTFRVTDPYAAATRVDDYRQALYREGQQALRAVVGTRDLEQFLSDKGEIVQQAREMLEKRAADFGVEIVAFGIRDIILPGDMRELMNRVTAARKAAEANLISRREETAAMRSQANTAKILENNPTLMRLRELETLERVAANGELKVMLGEKGLTEKIVGLI